MQYIIGLTGLIGSGKSVAGAVFESLGVAIIDTDKIAHQITRNNGIAIQPIKDEFGDSFINANGELNRGKIREIVFANPELRYKLEKILHPLILAHVLKQIKASASNYVVLIVPLLFKSLKYLSLINRSIFIDCQESILLSRVIKRSSMGLSEAQSILRTQVPRDLQLMLSDDVLHNNTDIATFTNQIIKLDQYYKKLFTGT